MLLASDLKDQRPRHDLRPTLLLWVDVRRLALGSRGIQTLDEEYLLAQLDEGHPLTSSRVRDLLAFERH